MAQPIPLEIQPRNPRAELRSRLDQAPEQHAEAVLAAYEVLQELHNRGVLEIMRGALAASDELLEKVVDNARTPKAIRGIRNLLFWRRILGSIEPEWFKGIFEAIPEGIAQATAERKQPVSFLACFGVSATKILCAVSLPPLTSWRHSDVTSSHLRVRLRKIKVGRL